MIVYNEIKDFYIVILGIYDGYNDEGQELFRDCTQPQGTNSR